MKKEIRIQIGISDTDLDIFDKWEACLSERFETVEEAEQYLIFELGYRKDVDGVYFKDDDTYSYSHIARIEGVKGC